jgi:hypothetical protein
VKKILAAVAVVLAIPLALFLVQGPAESGEVVVVRTLDDAGAPRETRLWVVDDADAGWLARLEAHPEIEVMRGDETLQERGIPAPARRERTNELMREKYGWADAYISWLVLRGDSVPIRLAPR